MRYYAGERDVRNVAAFVVDIFWYIVVEVHYVSMAFVADPEDESGRQYEFKEGCEDEVDDQAAWVFELIGNGLQITSVNPVTIYGL